MKNNERGGILSKLFIIPAGVALMLGFFFLGYYVGKYQSKGGSTAENLPPLPEVVSKNLPKPEEFTFYKTLTEKDSKTVSIDLKPKSSNPENKPERKEAVVSPKEHEQPAAKEKSAESRVEKKSAQPEPVKQTAVKPSPTPEKKTASIKQPASPKLRYTIQVSSHQEKQAAEEEVKRMKQNGFAAFIVASELPGKGTWYRVRLGSFTNRDAAEKLQKTVNAKVGISSIIVVE
jgi:DedD protein